MTSYKNCSSSVSPIVSTTILAAFLIISWFLIALLLLTVVLAYLLFKEDYLVRIHINCRPTPNPINKTPQWPAYSVVNQVAPLTTAALIVTNNHPHLLLLGLLGLLLITILSVLALALIVPLTLQITI
ncbi:uncharacterized protein FIBRA_09276 [Fibroporia radiculosa]|uniref:Uncharacterized protein n=1 Tax=Fibroporia radiculosa TaxID=599839 RepID=J7RHA8_9APHY|nr:uncharacterized protein FIBRA_09276 [Fibroporia radiculosa]CCM06962.1 predicted protein [Fibroporia radiculosa]